MTQINTDCFVEFPVLKTKRLSLREIRKADAEMIFAMRANGRMNQFIAREDMANPEDADQLVERVRKTFENRDGIGWAGILRDKNEIVGTCGFNSIDYPNLHAEIGGELSVDYWGKNIAIEAVTAIIGFGLNQLNLHTIEAKVNPENRGAIFLMEQIGFKKEAHFRERIFFQGKFSDLAVYCLVKGEEKLNSF